MNTLDHVCYFCCDNCVSYLGSEALLVSSVIHTDILLELLSDQSSQQTLFVFRRDKEEASVIVSTLITKILKFPEFLHHHL